jgi:hypothetical protein
MRKLKTNVDRPDSSITCLAIGPHSLGEYGVAVGDGQGDG